MAWARIDDDMYSHPKILSAGNEAVGVWVRMISWSNKHGTKGYIPLKTARWLLGKKLSSPVMRRLLDEKMLEPEKSGIETALVGYTIHDFSDYNLEPRKSDEKKSQLTEIRSKAGKKGAAKRWQTDGKTDGNCHGKNMANDSPVPVPGPVPIVREEEKVCQPEKPPPPSLQDFEKALFQNGMTAFSPNWYPLISQLEPFTGLEISKAIEHAKQKPGRPNPGLVLRIIEGWRAAPKKPNHPAPGTEWAQGRAKEDKEKAHLSKRKYYTAGEQEPQMDPEGAAKARAILDSLEGKMKMPF